MGAAPPQNHGGAGGPLVLYLRHVAKRGRLPQETDLSGKGAGPLCTWIIHTILTYLKVLMAVRV